MYVYNLILLLSWLSSPTTHQVRANSAYQKVLDDLLEDYVDPRAPHSTRERVRAIRNQNLDRASSVVKDEVEDHVSSGVVDVVEEVQQFAEPPEVGEKDDNHVRLTKEKGEEKKFGATDGKIMEGKDILRENELMDCKAKLEEKVKELGDLQVKFGEQPLVKPRIPDAGISYFKQFIRSMSAMLKPVDGDMDTLGVKLILKRKEYNELQTILMKESAKEILDLLKKNDAFQNLEPSVSMYPDVTSHLSKEMLLLLVALIIMLVITVCFVRRLFNHEIGARRQVVLFGQVLFVGFLFSIPWEWYRMYRVALSKKTSETIQGIPEECLPKSISVWKSVSLYFRNTFTFNDDKCVKYQESLLVDPIWEVSPLQATSVCLSRFFFEPLKYIAMVSGESFRLFFKEIPAQWQPIMFIALLVILIFLIVSCSGLRIETPLLKINVNPQPEVRYLPAPDAPVPVQNKRAIELEPNKKAKVRYEEYIEDIESENSSYEFIRRRKPLKRLENVTVRSGEVEEVAHGVSPRTPVSYQENENDLQIGLEKLNLNDSPVVAPVQESGGIDISTETLNSTYCRRSPEQITTNYPSESEYHSLVHQPAPNDENRGPQVNNPNDGNREAQVNNPNTKNHAPQVNNPNTENHAPQVNNLHGENVESQQVNNEQTSRNKLADVEESRGSILVPDPSSVFNISLGTDRSSVEMRYVDSRGIESRRSDNGDHVASVEDGYLLVDK